MNSEFNSVIGTAQHYYIDSLRRQAAECNLTVESWNPDKRWVRYQFRTMDGVSNVSYVLHYKDAVSWIDGYRAARMDLLKSEWRVKP